MSDKQIVVLGDVSLDLNVYKGIRHSPDLQEDGTVISTARGGSHMLYELIHELSKRYNLLARRHNSKAKKEKDKHDVYKCGFGLKEKLFEELGFPESLKTFAVWKDVNRDKCSAAKDDEKITPSWKMYEALGFGYYIDKDDKKVRKATPLKQYEKNCKVPDTKTPLKLLVLDDGGFHFRNAEKAWSAYLDQAAQDKGNGNKINIILKSASPLARGKLFNRLSTQFTEDLVMITSAEELRREDALISKGVSWEQTALDLVSELNTNPRFQALLNCRHLIINFSSEGALYLELGSVEEKKKRKIIKCRLVFDPARLEGDRLNKTEDEGSVIGLQTCFTAAIAQGFMEKDVNIDSMLGAALSAMRKYKELGHTIDASIPKFPTLQICDEITKPNLNFASAFVPLLERFESLASDPINRIALCKFCDDQFLPDYRNVNWSILEGNYYLDSNNKPLFDKGLSYALFGSKILANTPYLKMNKLITYDRREIEAIRNLKNLIDDYHSTKEPKRPLSLAVFGSPGSGKSFAVKQMSDALGLPFLEFNLSQFADVDELIGAFHQVRDEVLKGKMAFVFWDEFDSQGYKWLQYLLAPMQDGTFQQGEITHPIGKCVFIFAGATSYSYDTFGVSLPEEPDEVANKSEYKLRLAKYYDFIMKKGPDFKSRLSGHLDVQGPNQGVCLDKNGSILKDKHGKPVYDNSDINFPIRRAQFIRSMLGVKEETMDIDLGLLNALVRISRYEHGARTMEQILNHVKIKNHCRFQRSSLPSSGILTMLLDYNEFLKHLTHDLPDVLAYKAAPEIHKKWREIADKEGWRLPYHKDYYDLPTHLQEENIVAARRIEEIMKKQGLIAVPMADAELYPDFDYSNVIADNAVLETMAEAEHAGWVSNRENNGWHFGHRNDDRKIHDCMVKWDDKKPDGTDMLKASEKEKDRNSVKLFSEMLDSAGYMIVRDPEYASQ